MCFDCGTRPQISGDSVLCEPCDEYAGWENAHSDHGHDDIDTYSLENTHFTTQAQVDAYIEYTKADMTMCPVCHPELDTRSDTPRTGHTNTVAKTHTSHAGHNHPVTPAARAMCRKSMATTGNPFDARKTN